MCIPYAFIVYKGLVEVSSSGKKIGSLKAGEMSSHLELNNWKPMTLKAKRKTLVLLLEKRFFRAIMADYLKEQQKSNSQWIGIQHAFSRLSQRDISSICSRSELCFWPKGKRLVERNEEIQSIFVIKKGQVSSSFWFVHDFVNQWPSKEKNCYEKKVLRREFQVNEECPSGFPIGLLEVLSGIKDYEGSFVLLTDCEVLCIPKRLIQEISKERNPFEEFIKESLLQKERRAQKVRTEVKNQQKLVKLKDFFLGSILFGKQRMIFSKTPLQNGKKFFLKPKEVDKSIKQGKIVSKVSISSVSSL